MNAFDRYAPFIQDYIYKKSWDDLRQVQTDTCEAVLDRDTHILVSSSTASGKTEAAFFPILTDLHYNPSKTIGILYIGPLKALINDQFTRLDALLEEAQIPVFPWHGDVSQSRKKKAVNTAQGVLQITPESLEAMLMARAGEAVRLFSDLRYIVIDEIHAFMGSDRGLQVICQLTRLERLTGCAPRRIGLSATLHDVSPAVDFLTWGSTRKGEAVGNTQGKRTIQLAIHSYPIPYEEKEALKAWDAYYDFIYQNTQNKKCLIFTNNRQDAEKVITNLKDIAIEKKEKDIFHVHHGSVSATLRQEAEAALREEDSPIVTAATLTLELGIDIGDLDYTLQLGAPFTCSSFVQRLGRSGRRTGISKMLFVDPFENKEKDLFDQIPWTLLRSIAIIQLYSEEKWVEPFQVKEKPYSLLVHQTLSILMTYGEQSPSELARNVLTLPIFQGKITQEEFKTVLYTLLEQELIQTMDTGHLIIGLTGERITNHFTFFAVFPDEETFQVRSNQGDIGTLDTCPMIDEVFVLAGRTWQVTAIDQEQKIIFVTLSPNRRVPSWRGSGSHIHTKVVQRMKQVLQEDKIYPYLKESAVETLQTAREYARKIQLLQKDFFPYGKNSYYFCPWVGTKELSTIRRLLSVGLKDHLEIQSVSFGLHYLHVSATIHPEEWSDRLSQTTWDFNDPNLILSGEETPQIDKYDAILPTQLLRFAFLKNEMLVPDAMEILQRQNPQLLDVSSTEAYTHLIENSN